MEIEIKNGIIYDTDKSFDEQSQGCQDYFYDIMNTSSPSVVMDSFNRPITETWELSEPLKFYVIERLSVYKKQEPDWHLQSQIIKICEL